MVAYEPVPVLGITHVADARPTTVIVKLIFMWKVPVEPSSVVSRWKAEVTGEGKLPSTASVTHAPESVKAPDADHPAGGPPGNTWAIVIVTSAPSAACAMPAEPRTLDTRTAAIAAETSLRQTRAGPIDRMSSLVLTVVPPLRSVTNPARRVTTRTSSTGRAGV